MIATDEELLGQCDATSFELFYNRYFERVLRFFSSRTRDSEPAADLTAETFAAALAGQRRFRRHAGSADSWLFGIAYHKLADAQRRGYADADHPAHRGGGTHHAADAWWGSVLGLHRRRRRPERLDTRDH
jgi:DNA-directed RNA polymerase specialized sigma24 family protein